MTAPGQRISALLLGVDGGGTTTQAWLAEPGVCILGRGTSGPSNAKAVGLEAARRALESSIHAAFNAAGLTPASVDVACFGLAGFDRPTDRKILREWAGAAGWAHHLLIVNDGDLVVAAGTPEGWGIGLIAGTGSIAVGRTPDGRTTRSGGWGHLIGDEGSAYAVVLDALRLVARRADGREPYPPDRDRLTTRFCAALGVGDTSQIVTTIYAPDFDRTRIAALAPEILEICSEFPELGVRLLVPAGAALAEMVIAVARSLGWSCGELPLAVAGSFLLSATLVLETLIGSLRQQGYHAGVVRVPDPVRGAVVLAERSLLGER
jgi:N-acetylglucosamine kinase-like BadF-type ATPase